MKLGRFDFMRPKDDQLIASFGEAQLVKKLDGILELRGGSSDDRTAAKEWISLFCHEAVPRADSSAAFPLRQAIPAR
jgi:hypothetical protein